MCDDVNAGWATVDMDEWGKLLIQFVFFVNDMLDDETDPIWLNKTTGEFAFSRDAAERIFGVWESAKDLVEGFRIGRKAYDEKQEAKC